MGRARKIRTILVVAVAFCFGLASLAHAPKPPQEVKVLGEPIWEITQDGTDISVNWVDHAPNPRFAIYDPGTPEDESDDLVLDKETGLVWARNANIPNFFKTWQEAVISCRYLKIGNRKGWRLPTVEELASLVDTSQTEPALPSGHPFQNVFSDPYWSSTTSEAATGEAWYVAMSTGTEAYGGKSNTLYVWPVRGGAGPILVPHTP